MIVLGSQSKGDNMQISTFGSIQIAVVPKTAEVNEVVVVTENRRDTVRMDVNKAETVDQFARRI